MSVTLGHVLKAIAAAALKKTITTLNIGAAGYLIGNQIESKDIVTVTPIEIKPIIVKEDKVESGYQTYGLIICVIIFILLLLAQTCMKYFNWSSQKPRARVNAQFDV